EVEVVEASLPVRGSQRAPIRDPAHAPNPERRACTEAAQCDARAESEILAVGDEDTGHRSQHLVEADAGPGGCNVLLLNGRCRHRQKPQRRWCARHLHVQGVERVRARGTGRLRVMQCIGRLCGYGSRPAEKRTGQHDCTPGPSGGRRPSASAGARAWPTHESAVAPGVAEVISRTDSVYGSSERRAANAPAANSSESRGRSGVTTKPVSAKVIANRIM